MHQSTEALQNRLAHVCAAPGDAGTLEMVVSRPVPEDRAVLESGRLDAAVGLVGDNWLERGSSSTPDGASEPERQLTVMSARFVDLIAGDRTRWALAGDQLYVDLDLSEENLPAGTRLAIGDAVIEVTAAPHLGCAKFVDRFGADAMRLVNSPQGRALRLRGLHARVVHDGDIRPGDTVTKR